MLGTASQVPTRYRNHNGYFLAWDGEGILFDPGDGPEGTYILDFVGPDNAGLVGSNVTDPCTGTVIGRVSP